MSDPNNKIVTGEIQRTRGFVPRWEVRIFVDGLLVSRQRFSDHIQAVTWSQDERKRVEDAQYPYREFVRDFKRES